MSKLEAIIAHGNRGPEKSWGTSGDRPSSVVACSDGFKVSVIAGGGSYSYPRYDTPGPFDQVELGFPSARPEPWGTWEAYAESASDPTGTVYGYVPVDVVRDLITSHGGEA